MVRSATTMDSGDGEVSACPCAIIVSSACACFSSPFRLSFSFCRSATGKQRELVGFGSHERKALTPTEELEPSEVEETVVRSTSQSPLARGSHVFWTVRWGLSGDTADSDFRRLLFDMCFAWPDRALCAARRTGLQRQRCSCRCLFLGRAVMTTRREI